MGRLPDGREPYTTSGYGSREGGFHRGFDQLYPHADEPLRLPWTDPKGKWSVPDAAIGLAVPALAAGPGKVVFAKWTQSGYNVRIQHAGGWYTAYMHMSKLLVKVGQHVTGGQPLGIISNSPYRLHCTSTPTNRCKVGLNHIHWQLETGNGSSYAIDPEPHLGRHLERLPLLDVPSDNFLITAALTVGVAFGVYKLLT